MDDVEGTQRAIQSPSRTAPLSASAPSTVGRTSLASIQRPPEADDNVTKSEPIKRRRAIAKSPRIFGLTPEVERRGEHGESENEATERQRENTWQKRREKQREGKPMERRVLRLSTGDYGVSTSRLYPDVFDNDDIEENSVLWTPSPLSSSIGKESLRGLPADPSNRRTSSSLRSLSSSPAALQNLKSFSDYLPRNASSTRVGVGRQDTNWSAELSDSAAERGPPSSHREGSLHEEYEGVLQSNPLRLRRRVPFEESAPRPSLQPPYLSFRRSSTSSNERDASFHRHRSTLPGRTFMSTSPVPPLSRVSSDDWLNDSDGVWGPSSFEDDVFGLTTRRERQNSLTSIGSTGSMEMRPLPLRREPSSHDDHEDGIRPYAHRPARNRLSVEESMYRSPLLSPLSPFSSQASSRRSSVSNNERDYVLNATRPTLHTGALSSSSRGSHRDSSTLSTSSSPAPYEVLRPSSFENDTVLRPASTELGRRSSVTNTKLTSTPKLLRPRLPPSPWKVYFTDWIQAQQTIGTHKLDVAQAAKEASQEYMSLTNEERKPYLRRSQAAEEAYEREMRTYLRTLTPDDINCDDIHRSAEMFTNRRYPNAPKKPNAYFLFLQHFRKIFPNETETTNLNLKQSQLAASKWRSMTDAERQPFLVQAEIEARKANEEGLSTTGHRPSNTDFDVPPERSFRATTRLGSDNEYDSDGRDIHDTIDPSRWYRSSYTSSPSRASPGPQSHLDATIQGRTEESSPRWQPYPMEDRENREMESGFAINREEEVRRMEETKHIEELKRKEEEARQREEEAKRREEELHQREDHLKMQEQAIKARETELESLAASTRRLAIHSILVDVRHYRLLLKCVGKDAQTLLDFFQSLLDNGNYSERGKLIVAMQRLSAKTELYPFRYVLDGPVRLIQDHPVNAGRFADIYKAEFRGELTCLKVIRVYESYRIQHMAKIYAREAILWGQLSHPNLLPFYGLYIFRSQLAFVAPWAENGNLTDYLARVPNANRVLLCADTSAGIEYLHANNVVHGDLKALNVLVDGSGRACLSDFGLSGVADKDIVQWATQSSTSSKGGTTRWQAPELHDPEVDKVRNTKESDVFAWASTCYEVFTGNPPFFEIQRDTTVAFMIFRGDLPTRPHAEDSSWKERGLTEGIWELLTDCWCSKPSERPGIAAVISRLDHEKPTQDPRPPGQWQGGLAMRFRNTQVEVNAQPKRASFENLDAILSKVMHESRFDVTGDNVT